MYTVQHLLGLHNIACCHGDGTVDGGRVADNEMTICEGSGMECADHGKETEMTGSM